MPRLIGLLLVGSIAAGCASAPRQPPTVILSLDQKLALILRLEDHRILREPAPETVQPEALGSRRDAPLPSPPAPGLVQMLADPEARVRRRAALAVGRVGLAEGVTPLIERLGDLDPEVRQMSAFALGLLGDASATEPLLAALADPDPVVRGRVAESLGRLGAVEAAGLLGEMVKELLAWGAGQPDDVGSDLDPNAEALRLALLALGELGDYDALAGAVLDASGQPAIPWWPVAYALQRLDDPRFKPALTTFARWPAGYGAALAVAGLGRLKDPESVGDLTSLLDSEHPLVALAAIRALAEIGDPRAVGPLLDLLRRPELSSHLALETVRALGRLGTPEAAEIILELVSARAPAMRAAALRSIAELDPQLFTVVLAGLDPDPQWSVRATLAGILGRLDLDLSIPRLRSMLDDPDQRVVPAVLEGLVERGAPDAPEVLLRHLTAADEAVRKAAARGIGQVKPENGVPALVEAYDRGRGDESHVARAAVLGALADYGTPEAVETIRTALSDTDWAVRVHAASLLETLDPTQDYATAIRPAPVTRPADAYERPELVDPSVSPHVYLETDKGTVQLEMAVLDAPLTVDSFITLARRGFFDGSSFHRVVPGFVVQDGDPRGDGEGGPGYTLRNEVNERPFLAGTVGVALDWADTGGSQFFITLAPQPQLDGRYPVFGRVISGMEVIASLEPWDVIRRVIVWDGTER